MQAHQNNAIKIAQFLQEHQLVKRVYYPGLQNHKGYEINARPMVAGGMLAFELLESNRVDEFLASLRILPLPRAWEWSNLLFACPLR